MDKKPKPALKVDPKEPQEELGVLFRFDDGELTHVEKLKPLTLEEAEDFVLAQLQAFSYYQEEERQEPPAMYWVPFSAFKPMRKTPAENLSQEHIKSKKCNCFLCTMRRQMGG